MFMVFPADKSSSLYLGFIECCADKFSISNTRRNGGCRKVGGGWGVDGEWGTCGERYKHKQDITDPSWGRVKFLMP